ncbi:MAG: dihydrodipicolinate synthase family protein, partial [Lachnospiraceae bacterium]|nr:dihydrodipicolinate synthase family protein [Lachnospiraceae bacterium]
MAIFKGSGVALVTPMKENGQINYDALEALIEDQLANHTDAFIICGTTGEAPTLGFAEANDKGMQYALDKGYDYVYLLNQDAWL